MILENIKKPLEKTFFSMEFSLSLKFYPDGGIKGLLHPFVRAAPSLTTEVTGFYSNLESLQLVGFVAAGPNDFSYDVQSCFTGRTIKYNVSNECLILKWVVFCDSLSFLKSTIHDDVFVLFDSRKKNYDAEIQQNHIIHNSLRVFKKEVLC